MSIEPSSPAVSSALAVGSQPPPDPRAWDYDPGFSRFVTILSAFVFCACAGLVTYIMWTSEGLDRIALPERALSLMVGRTMDVEEAVKQAPDWERTLQEWVSGGDPAQERAEAISWYEELADRTTDASVYLQLAILQAESGHLSKVDRRVKEWARREPPFSTFAKVLQGAYYGAQFDRDTLMGLQAEVADLLPAGWFYDRVAIRLAGLMEDAPLLASLEEAANGRADRLFTWSRWVFGVEFAALLAGTGILLYAWRRRDPDFLRYGGAKQPPVWPGGIGARVLLRGGAIGAVLLLLLMYYGSDHPVLRMVAIPLTNLPLLVLAQRHLLEPAGLGFREGFGLRSLPGRGARLGLAVLPLVALGLIGEWVIGRIAEPLSLSSHWTEWFDGDLVWAPTPVLLLSLAEYVVLAPIFEELAFRGLLYGVLRRRFGFAPAAISSAALFSVAHGYGVLGFLGVFWSGLVWAWGYEKTGSLLPGIIAHGINNLLVCLSVIALLRT